ncbi:MAG: hypothetical protein J5792_06865 [Bacteroidales bacterium]|nr:hypothetical protein [Bacteroidales bacterium]
MNSKDIKKLLQEGEQMVLEAKRAESAAPKSMWASYSALFIELNGTNTL